MVLHAPLHITITYNFKNAGALRRPKVKKNTLRMSKSILQVTLHS